jgi:TolA-binding protein
MKQQLLKWWPVIVGICMALGWVVSSSIELGELKSDTAHQHESAKEQRTDLQEEDVRIYKRIDKTDKKVNRLKKKVESTSDTLIRIDTQQSVIIKNQEKILTKLEAP